MNRLTERAKDGLAYSDIPLNQSSVLDANENIVECYTGFIADRLAAYEDTGRRPEDFLILENELEAYKEEYLKYKDLEEQGLLIRLPCKVGDIVYQNNYDRTIENYKVVGFEIDERGKMYVRVLIARPAATIKLSFQKEDLYFTQEEAEKALKELEGKQ